MALNIGQLFQMIDGAGVSGKRDGQLSKEELKSFLETNNPDKSEAEIADKIEQVQDQNSKSISFFLASQSQS